MIGRGVRIGSGAFETWALALVLVVAAPLVALLEAQKGKPLPEVPVTVSFGTGALQSDTGADYVNGSDNVLAVVYPSGNVGLNTQANTRQDAIRSVCLDFGDQLPELGPQPTCVSIGHSAGPYVAPERVAMQSMHYTVPEPQAVLAAAWFGWKVAGPAPGTSTHYRLWYGWDSDGNGDLDTPPVKVTCTAGGSQPGQCTEWTVATQASGTATLQSSVQTIKGGKVTSGPVRQHGVVDMPFLETIARQ